MAKSSSKLVLKITKQPPLPPPRATTTGKQGSPTLERDSGIPHGEDVNLTSQCPWRSLKNDGFLGDYLRGRTAEEGRDESTSHRSDFDRECNVEDISATTKRKFNQLINGDELLEQNAVIAQQYSSAKPNLSLQSYTIDNVETALNRDKSYKTSAGAGDVCTTMNQEDQRRERRKQSNRESAKRSRLRRMQQRERLEAIIGESKEEHCKWAKQLRCKSMECWQVSKENRLLEEELVQLYGPAALEGLVNPENESNPNCSAEMVTAGGNSTPDQTLGAHHPTL